MAKVKLDIQAKDSASPAIKSVTGSFLKAEIALEAIKVTFRKVVDVSKESIEAFKVQEAADKQLETVLKSTNQAAGLTAEEIKNLAEELSNVTKFADETIQSGQNILLTFTKIGKDVFPQATETVLNMSQAMGQDLKSSAIQLGKALNDPITGAAALRRVGVSLTEAQMEQIKVFQESGDIMSAQKIILKELNTEFGNSARAARETFGGALEALNNTTVDIKESFGKIISIVGKDFVDSMNEGSTEMKEFLNNTENMKVIITVLNLLRSTLMTVLKVIKINFKAWKSFFDLAVIGGKLLWNFLDPLLNIKDTIFNLAKAISEKLKPAMEWFNKTFQKGKEVVGDFVDDIKSKLPEGSGAFDQFTDDLKKFGEGWKEEIVGLADPWADFQANLDKQLAMIEKKIEDVDPKIEEPEKKVRKSFFQLSKDMVEEWDKAWGEMSSQERYEKITAEIKKWGDIALGVVTGVLDTIQMAFDTASSNRLASIQESSEEQLAAVDESIQRELEMLGLAEETKQEALQSEIDDLNEQLSQRLSAKGRADLEEQLQEKQDELARQQILDAGEKRKERIRKKAEKKENEEKKKQFEQNKKSSIANIWINAASAVLGWYAAFASMGIPGVVLASVMAAATLAMAGVQAGIVSQQNYHAQEGGVIPVGATSGDNVQLNANRGEAVLRDDDYNMLIDQIKSGGQGNTIIIEQLILQSDDPADMVEQLTEIARYEGARG